MTDKKKRAEPSPEDIKYATTLRRKAAQERAAEKLYTEGTWSGKVNYECKACPFATLDHDLIRQHVTIHL